MIRKIAALIVSAAAAAVFAVSASAADAAYYLNQSDVSEWSGADVAKNETHSVLSVLGGEAYMIFPADGYNALMLYLDGGNYSGSSAGSVILSLLDADGNVTASYEKEITVDGKFRRYSFGSESAYAEIPENTDRIKISVTGGASGPYYRNTTLVLSNTAPRFSGETEWLVSGETGLVQVNVKTATYWTWVVIVFAVALIMFGVRKAVDKTGKKKL